MKSIILLLVATDISRMLFQPFEKANIYNVTL
jgi:hypothetical protein